MVLIFKLPLVLPADFWRLLLFAGVSVLAALIYFFFSFIFSSFSFWYPEHDGWPLRFLMLTFLEFLAGTAFPLDIFSPAVNTVLKFLPTTYLIYFPAQVYLGRLDTGAVIQGITIMIIWLAIFIFLTKYIWKKGLEIYGAYGR
jgi:ABC-2 type transport system permease protein